MARRSGGEGTIAFDRERKLWVARLSMGYDAKGKRIRRRVYGKTQREAREKLEQLRRSAEQGVSVTSGRAPTLAELLQVWLAEVHKPRVRPTTYRRDEWVALKRLTPALGRHRVSALTPLHVEKLLREMVADGLTPRTAQHTRSVLRAALNQAMRWGLVSRNVAALAEPPAMRRKEVAHLDKAQSLRLLQAVEGDRLEALVTVALGVGLRQGEALGLTWDAVDLEGGTLTIRQTLQRVDGEYVYLPPKTSKSRRTIPLPGIAVQALRRHRTRQLEDRLRRGEKWDDHGLVFTGANGQPLYGPFVTRRFQRILASTCQDCSGGADGHAAAHEFRSLPRLRFHDLRHSCASLLLAQGVPLSTIQEVLGHTSYAFTRDVYAHLSEELKRDAATAMDSALGG